MAAPRDTSIIALDFPRTTLTGVLITGDQSKLSITESGSLAQLIRQLNDVPEGKVKDINYTFMNFYLFDGYIPQKSRKKAPLGLGHLPVKGNLLEYLEESIKKFNDLTHLNIFKGPTQSGKSEKHLESILLSSITWHTTAENANKIIANLIDYTFGSLLYEKKNEFVNCIKALIRTNLFEIWDKIINEQLKQNPDAGNLLSNNLRNKNEGKIEDLYDELIKSGLHQSLQQREMRSASQVKIHLPPGPGGK